MAFELLLLIYVFMAGMFFCAFGSFVIGLLFIDDDDMIQRRRKS